jgi:hypothetical protein
MNAMPRRTVLPVTSAAAAAAAARIAERRRACDDPDLERLSDAPLEVVDYVLACRQVPREVLAADVLDALVLLERARAAVPATQGRLDRAEAGLLDAAAAAGVPLSRIANRLGLASRSAVLHRRQRLAAAARGGPRRETHERAARRAEDAQAAWLARHGGELLAATGELVAARAVFTGELAEEVAHIGETAGRVPAPAAADYVTKMGYLASRLRLFLTGLDDSAAGGAQAGGAGPAEPPAVKAVIARLRGLTSQHRDLFDKPRADWWRHSSRPDTLSGNTASGVHLRYLLVIGVARRLMSVVW